jgi:hypothetical protein
MRPADQGQEADMSAILAELVDVAPVLRARS